MQVGTHRKFKLPYGIVKIKKGDDGQRVIEGLQTCDPSLSHIPYVGKDPATGNLRALSRAEREAMALDLRVKAERKAKREAKKLAEGKSLPKEEKEATKGKSAPPKGAAIPVHTVKRDGKWVQVGADNLTAFVEAR